MTIHEKLKLLRINQMDLSIRELANELAIPHSNYARVERSQLPDLKLLSKLSLFYGIPLAAMFKDVDPIK